MTVTGVKSKSIKAITVKDTVKIKTTTFKVTAIGDSAFKNCKKASKVTIGKNIEKIGKTAFYQCKNLKAITVKSTKISKVGKNALKGIHAKAKIKMPKSKLKKYQKLFKNKGQKKTVKIVKN